MGLAGVVLALVAACLIAVWVTRGMKGPAAAGKLHAYRSTACFHGLHERCRKQCKFCCVLCDCSCHVPIEQEEKAAVA